MTMYVKRCGIFALHASIGSVGQGPSGPLQEDYWSALTTTSHRMHASMDSVKKSGGCDADFVKLMLPHHPAAIDMAKAQLLHGPARSKVRQLRRT